jgi:hypothetical protein
VTPAYPLRVETALYSAGATVADLVLSPIVWANASGVKEADGSLTKTAADGWNAAATTTQAITAATAISNS